MTSQQQRNQHQAEILAKSRGYTAEQITEINLSDNGELASISVGVDDDGMARFVLNFGL